MTQPLRIAFLTPWDIDDPRSWSGIVNPMFTALAGVADVVPVSTKEVATTRIDRALAKLVGTATSRRYLWDFGVATARKRGGYATQRAEAARVDAVFAVAASVDIAYLRGQTPVVQYVDATFEAMQDEYPVFTGIHPLSTAQVRFVGERANRRTSRYVAASRWAVDALARDAAVGTELCTIAPPGAAIMPAAPRPPRSDGPLRALLVASDWQRKGGDRAIAAVQNARDRGADVELRVVGVSPSLPSWATGLGKLGHAELSTEYLRADVLMEPALANAAGVTLTDAAAHGLPAIATRIGGVEEIVDDERTGWLLDAADDVSRQLADRLVQIDADRGILPTFSAAARERYATELDWHVWAERALNVCATAVRDRQDAFA